MRSKIGIIYRKELLDSLRDRRTIISAIVIPIFLFPLIILGFGSMAASSVRKVQMESSDIMILGETRSPALAASVKKSGLFKIIEPSTNYAALVSAKKARAVLSIPEGFDEALRSGTNGAPQVKIFHYSGEIRSQVAVRNLQNLLRAYSDQVVAGRLAKSGLSAEMLKPFQIVEENVAPAEKVGGNLMGGMIPYMIIFLSFVGAMAPAIDLTAGEKERGTIETILASPVSRTDLVLGKFLMVLTASIVTTVISLTSFAMTFTLPLKAVRQAGAGGGIPFDLSASGMGSVFLLVLPVAIMFSAGALAIALQARTHKEAQSYLSPLMMVVIMPAMAAMLPGLDLSLKLAFVPILNVSLVSKELLTGNYPWPLITVVFASSCLYAAVALRVAVAAFNKESVLFRS